MRGLWLRLTCSWFVLGLRCAVRGHEYRAQYLGGYSYTESQRLGIPYRGPTHRIKMCVWCGNYGGARRVTESVPSDV